MALLAPPDSHPGGESMPWAKFSGLELFEEIGRGGMGVVYRARQTGLDRMVAVKVLLRAPFAGDEERGRFQREARAAARLSHPGIIGIYDVGESDGVPWFSMEYIRGESLQDRIGHQAMAPDEAARMVRAIAAAVQHAHDSGVLHRDLKPSNILLTEDGRPMVGDFGIARMGGPGSPAKDFTRTGQMLGSPGHAAPEQVLDGESDPRTDVYGLGALLYHLVTASPPFQGATLESILIQLREDEPIPLRRRNPEVPGDLETICLKCLRKSPDSRYPSAAEVAADLGRYLDRKPISARPPGPAGRVWRWTRRHPAMASLLVVSTMMLVGLAVGALLFARHQVRVEHRASLVAEARVLRHSNKAGGRTEALEKLRQAWGINPSDEIRQEAVACLALPAFGPMRKGNARPPDPSLSADGQFSAAFSGKEIVIRDTTTGNETARLRDPLPGSLLKLDDHGRRLAVADPATGRMHLVSLGDFQILAICDHRAPIHDIDWSGELIATSSADRFIHIWDANGHLLHRLTGHQSPVIRLAFRPATQELASSAADSHVRLWHAARGTEIIRHDGDHRAHDSIWWSADGLVLHGDVGREGSDDFPFLPPVGFDLLSPPRDEPHSENLGSADLSPDGRFAMVIDEQSARLWDFHLGKTIYQRPKSAGQWLSARFHPDGRGLFLCGWADELSRLPLLPQPDGRILPGPVHPILPGHGNLLRDISPDGSLLVLSNDTTGDFTVVSGEGKISRRIHHPGTLATSLCPDGLWLVTSSYLEPGAKIWSLSDGKPARSLCPSDMVMQTAFLSRDRLLIRTTKGIHVFQIPDWNPQPGPPAGLRIQAMTASRDGRLLALLCDNQIRLIETTRFREILRLTPPAHAGWLGECHLVFDAGATRLFVHTALGTVMRWHLPPIEDHLSRLGFTP